MFLFGKEKGQELLSLCYTEPVYTVIKRTGYIQILFLKLCDPNKCLNLSFSFLPVEWQ